jgi:hypothetical protein
LVAHKTALLWYERLGGSQSSYKINRITAAIGVILAFSGKEDVLFQLKITGASEKFKNQPRQLF